MIAKALLPGIDRYPDLEKQMQFALDRASRESSGRGCKGRCDTNKIVARFRRRMDIIRERDK